VCLLLRVWTGLRHIHCYPVDAACDIRSIVIYWCGLCECSCSDNIDCVISHVCDEQHRTNYMVTVYHTSLLMLPTIMAVLFTLWLSGHSGLVVACLPAAEEVPGSNSAVDISFHIYHKNHCNRQLWAQTVQLLQCLGWVSLPPSTLRGTVNEYQPYRHLCSTPGMVEY